MYRELCTLGAPAHVAELTARVIRLETALEIALAAQGIKRIENR